MSVAKKPVEHGIDGRRIPQQLAPVFHGSIGSHQCTGAFVAPDDEFEQLLGGGEGKLAHAEVVDDEQWHGGQRLQTFFAGAVQSG